VSRECIRHPFPFSLDSGRSFPPGCEIWGFHGGEDSSRVFWVVTPYSFMVVCLHLQGKWSHFTLKMQAAWISETLHCVTARNRWYPTSAILNKRPSTHIDKLCLCSPIKGRDCSRQGACFCVSLRDGACCCCKAPAYTNVPQCVPLLSD
jgi:hypothetical protein